MTLDDKGAPALLEMILAEAQAALPGADTSASVRAHRRASTRFARGQITSTGDVEEIETRVCVALGRRAASTTINQTDADAVRAAIHNAARLARLTPENPEHMPLLGPQRYLEVPAAYDPSTADLDAAARAAVARRALVAADTAGVYLAGFYEHSGALWLLGNSAGLRAAHRDTRASLSMTARTPDGSGSGWAGAFANRAAEIDAPALTSIAVDKAVRAAKPRRLAPGRYTVVLEPAAVAALMWFLVDALDARRADEGRSFFSKPGGGTKLGERIAAPGVSFASDPSDPLTPAAPFGGAGFPLRPRTWITDGTLSALIYSRYWAARQDKEPTGSPNVFHLAGGTAAMPELLRGVTRGVLITRFWYTNWVDPQAMLVTGLSRDGTFLIERGEIVGPVNNFRFNESPITMLRNADALSRDTARPPDGDGHMRVPALRTHEFNLASISDAV